MKEQLGKNILLSYGFYRDPMFVETNALLLLRFKVLAVSTPVFLRMVVECCEGVAFKNDPEVPQIAVVSEIQKGQSEDFFVKMKAESILAPRTDICTFVIFYLDPSGTPVLSESFVIPVNVVRNTALIGVARPEQFGPEIKEVPKCRV